MMHEFPESFPGAPCQHCVAMLEIGDQRPKTGYRLAGEVGKKLCLLHIRLGSIAFRFADADPVEKMAGIRPTLWTFSNVCHLKLPINVNE